MIAAGLAGCYDRAPSFVPPERTRTPPRNRCADHEETRLRAFGPNLRQFRKSRRMTQTELATAVGVAPAYVSQIEASLRVPSLRVAQRLAQVLDVELPTLLGADVPESRPGRLSDAERLEMLRALIRAVEDDRETRPPGEEVEAYPGAAASRLSVTRDEAVRSYVFETFAVNPRLFSHEGRETVYCAAGRARVQFEDEAYSLEPGQVRSFDAARPHVVLGEPGTLVISTAVPPPSFESVQQIASALVVETSGRDPTGRDVTG